MCVCVCSIRGGSKGVINFPWIFYAMRNLVTVGHFWNTSGHLFTCLRVFSVTPWVIVY